MKCEGYGNIQVKCANTWSDDESKVCNERDDICNESMAPVSLSTVEQCSSDMTISTSCPPVEPSTYESPASMTKLGPSDGATINAKLMWKVTMIKKSLMKR